MTVEEFARLVQLEADKFRDGWLKESKKDATAYPKALEEGDWWDQFVNHLATTSSINPRRR